MARILATLLSLVVIGCNGIITDPGATADNPVSPTAVPPSSIDPDDPRLPPPPAVPDVASTPTARLNPTEIRNSIEDLFGPAALDGVSLGDSAEGVLVTPVSATDAISVFFTAEAIAQNVVTSGQATSCTPDAPAQWAGCFDEVLQTWGRRLFRRPPTDTEIQRYIAEAMTADTYEEGLFVIVATLVASPKFLYRPELGDPATSTGAVRLVTQYELASRLSYGIWQSTPDEALLDAAAAGELANREQIEAQVQRMLEHPRARQTVARFHAWWLDLDHAANLFRDQSEYPAFEEDMPSAWVAETKAFAEHVAFDSQGTLQELVTATYTLADPSVAAVYGGTDGGGLVELPANERAGILTHAALLAAHAPDERTAPLYRGAFVYRKVLCGDLHDPPPGVPPLPEEDPDASLRDQTSTATTSGEPCVGCHARFNAYGFALGNFDAIGAFLQTDANGHAVDPAVTLGGPGDLAGAQVANPADLGQVLAQSAALRDCYVDRWFRYLTGRDIEPANGDEYSRLSAQFGFETANRDIQALIVELHTSDALRYVRAPTD